nr:C. briggsae CBR-NAS-29 protein [Haemonchus contortus]
MDKRFCNRVAIGILILVLFDYGLCLSEKGRLALQKALRGVDLEKRRERLHKLGGNRGEFGSNHTRPIPILPDPTGEDEALGAEEMSRGDGSSIVDVNRMEGVDEYLFEAACAGNVPKCVNGGVPNPRNCAVCNCPAGYGGALCNLKPAACGATLTATAAWQTKKVAVGDAAITTTSDSYKTCVDWVKAPAGKKVQIRVTAMQGVNCNDGCWTQAIEPKIMADKKMTNSRICCPGQLNQIWPSALNPTPIVSYSIRRVATFTYQYRYI